MPPMQNAANHWDDLHLNPRFRPLYPTDHVVRFMMASRHLLEGNRSARFLDIGMGAGRHMKLAADLAFIPFGVDISLIGIQHARKRLQDDGVHGHFAKASMLSLPFTRDAFETLLGYGVFYYGTSGEMKQAIREARRVLAPGGRAFIVLRTTDDHRFAKGDRIEKTTFRLAITETNEAGTIQHFLAADDIPTYFAEFSELSFEKSETTFGGRAFLNSDWLVTVQK